MKKTIHFDDHRAGAIPIEDERKEPRRRIIDGLIREAIRFYVPDNNDADFYSKFVSRGERSEEQLKSLNIWIQEQLDNQQPGWGKKIGPDYNPGFLFFDNTEKTERLSQEVRLYIPLSIEGMKKFIEMLDRAIQISPNVFKNVDSYKCNITSTERAENVVMYLDHPKKDEIKFLISLLQDMYEKNSEDFLINPAVSLTGQNIIIGSQAIIGRFDYFPASSSLGGVKIFSGSRDKWVETPNDFFAEILKLLNLKITSIVKEKASKDSVKADLATYIETIEVLLPDYKGGGERIKLVDYILLCQKKILEVIK